MGRLPIPRLLEAAGLQEDLRRAGIEPWAWIVNNSIAAAHTRSPLLRKRAHNEHREVVAVLIWFMVYPMMVSVDFSSLKRIHERPKGLIITLAVNWLIKPFTMDELGIDISEQRNRQMNCPGFWCRARNPFCSSD